MRYTPLFSVIGLLLLAGCQSAPESVTAPSEALSAEAQLERDLVMYEQIWHDFLVKSHENYFHLQFLGNFVENPEDKR